jgi:hypothetical protein
VGGLPRRCGTWPYGLFLSAVCETLQTRSVKRASPYFFCSHSAQPW